MQGTENPYHEGTHDVWRCDLFFVSAFAQVKCSFFIEVGKNAQFIDPFP